MSKNEIIKRFEAKKAEQKKLFETIASKDLKAYNSGGWTPAQIFNHIIAAQEGSLKVLLKKQEKGVYFPVPTSHRFNYFLLRLFFYFGLKTKAPAIFEEPKNEGNAKFFQETLEAQENKFIEIVENTSEENLKLSIFKHPLTGYMNGNMMAHFMQLHWQHHQKQILSRL